MKGGDFGMTNALCLKIFASKITGENKFRELLLNDMFQIRVFCVNIQVNKNKRFKIRK